MGALKENNHSAGLEFNICTGCHSTYNDGYLFDRWHKLSSLDEVKELWKTEEKYFLDCLKKERPEWDKEGYITDHYCEEMYMADFEVYLDGEYLDLDFGESFGALIKFFEVVELENLNNPIDLLMHLFNGDCSHKTIKEIDDNLSYSILEGHGDTRDYNFGYEMAESTGVLDEVPDSVKNYFDYEKFGYDILINDYSIYEVGGVEYAVCDHCF